MAHGSFRFFAPLLASAVIAFPVSAATLFADGFESGTKALTTNGFRWSDSTDLVAPSTSTAHTGKYALKFPFRGGALGTDSFQEQRLTFGKAYSELWVKYDLYLPSNYYHRKDDPSNNKFFAIFNNKYSPGFQVNFSLSPDTGGGSRLDVHYYKNGIEQLMKGDVPIFSPADFGKWHRIVMHFKVPSSLSTSDGVQELWKNGQQIFSVKNLASNGTAGLNYMDEAYILGWANSGFNQETVMYVDDVLVADTPIALTDGATPAAPILQSVE